MRSACGTQRGGSRFMFSDFDARAREIRGRFIAKASVYEARLHTLMAQLDDPSAASGSIDELYQIGHLLAGSAATFGFKTIAKAADNLEAGILAQRASGKMDSSALRALCNRLLTTIQEGVQCSKPAPETPSDKG